ncbi:MAG: GNAT family N-acetyltransferase, partial [Anaerolineae bacterium]
VSYDRRLKIDVRRERPGDEAAVRRVEIDAFGRPNDADVVDLLRRNRPEGVSLVAIVNDQIAGHVLFEPATIEGVGGTLNGAGLGPLAVLPAYQRQGAGSALVRYGLEEMCTAGHPYVIPIGHPRYYPRFGFLSPAPYGACYEPDHGQAFMIFVIDENAVRAHPGVARERPEFASC